MLTGNIGRPGTGVNPLRGQNNVQGACDMGGLPNVYPGYQNVTLPEVKEKFEKAWNVSLSDKVGLTVTEMVDLAIAKGLRSASDYDIEQQMAHMNHSVTGIRTLFLPCRPEFAFVSSRFIREIAAHRGAIDHLVSAPVAAALADRFGSSSP